MDLRSSLARVLNEYAHARTAPLTDHPLAEFIRHDIPRTIQEALSLSERYKTEGSPGKGRWTNVPWIAVFDRLVTESAQRGYYVVYLFCEDMSGVFLSLNQGVTTVREQYGAEARAALRTRALDFLAQLGDRATPYIQGPIDLKSAGDLGEHYGAGSICARFYPADAFPSNHELVQDLAQLLQVYFLLTDKEIVRVAHTEREDDEATLGDEDLRLVRTHKRIERNQKLAKMAKAVHGYTCMVCEMNFSSVYGDLGKEYIEAHHLTPLSQLKGQKVALDVRKDFAVLCANCHRMIHRSGLVDDIAGFKAKHYRRT
jgi:5-methylcytosine-specific restriction protein A